MSDLHRMKNDHQALPALLCLHQKSFLLPPDSIFTCWDIWEIPHEKTVAYAQALQFWVEKVNLPTEGIPHHLAGSVIELWEEMECYLCFSDDDVFKGVAPLEETSFIPPEEVTPQNAQPTPASKGGCHGYNRGACCGEEAPKQVLWLGKVLHPSRPVVATGQIPPLLRGLRKRPLSQSMGEGLVQIPQTEEPSVSTTQLEPP